MPANRKSDFILALIPALGSEDRPTPSEAKKKQLWEMRKETDKFLEANDISISHYNPMINDGYNASVRFYQKISNCPMIGYQIPYHHVQKASHDIEFGRFLAENIKREFQKYATPYLLDFVVKKGYGIKIEVNPESYFFEDKVMQGMIELEKKRSGHNRASCNLSMVVSPRNYDQLLRKYLRKDSFILEKDLEGTGFELHGHKVFVDYFIGDESIYIARVPKNVNIFKDEDLEKMPEGLRIILGRSEDDS